MNIPNWALRFLGSGARASFDVDLGMAVRPAAGEPRRARPVEVDYFANLGHRLGHQPVMIDLQALSSHFGCDGQRRPYVITDRVAVIQVTGVLSNDPWWWDETGYQEIVDEVTMAVNDSEVDAICLAINSPGGSTDGLYEAVDAVHAAGKKKDLWCVAAPIAYSAAYMFASQGKVLYTPPVSGGVGSIGVYMVHWDMSEALKKAGYTPTLISAGKGKTDGNPYEPLSKDVRDKFQAEVDRLYSEFVARVSRGRGLEKSEIIKIGAELFDGATAAIAAGLADKAGTLNDAVATLAASAAKKRGTTLASASENETPEEVVLMSHTSAAAANPSQPTALPQPAPATEASIDAASDMRQIINLCAIAGKPELVQGFVAKNMSAAAVQTALLEQAAARSNKPGELRAGVLASEATNPDRPAKSCAEIMRDKLKKEGVL